ncbi:MULTISPECIES: Fe-Mn family superoxide dismutase [unclassified Paenibacillus]|uniref:Fe-Mn family superoxide dismutase n=1 Tax=unclassified Paenibacillus TaxID=185978 RepID=UPI002406CF9A|nr:MULTISPECIES: Fe-Mn family superoxide dismutase [unclassified Paenibacillus]MDF9844697.1 Fe-Mn family superoxide dismutase [Paenibacillus sp. PastF-2]MDF9851299.1 Fe-Mn family superoxide dismutase [Paenibacillus sp. PastM-2]MDF9857882.1 Fe-Mn family superoxide dismutase [Paenibacillus sp. PastF-1]MDH6483148.1 Fe-Mn family superoxide dismutase [Paenibacillus sp. PastH-2]MDH6510595.1 Fe-Mn family superoxide dismutase [Paenibacillus sp. PastM-3]
MLYIYGPLLPVRILEEIIFWKTQEKEHTEVIKGIVPRLEQPYVKLLDEWAVVFGAAEQAARRLLEVSLESGPAGHTGLAADTEQLVHTACGQSREFIRQLYALREASAAVNAQPLAGIVIVHIIRESEYFLAVLGTLSAPGQVAGLMREAAIDQPELYQPDFRAESADPFAPSFPGAPQPELREPGTVPVGGHTLPPLPYAYNALEPYIDEKTMVIHHDKHHQSYVDGLNKAELKLAEARKNGDFDLVKHWERELAFNGAGHYLHTIFWNVMSPQGGGRPTGALLDAIERSFGSYDAFKTQFTEAANKVEGGGWALLVWSPRSRRLEILTAEKHQNLSQWDVVPLLALDVWEHAYYLKHQNNRADYTKDWWKVVNWPYVSERYAAARKLMWQPF